MADSKDFHANWSLHGVPITVASNRKSCIDAVSSVLGPPAGRAAPPDIGLRVRIVIESSLAKPAWLPLALSVLELGNHRLLRIDGDAAVVIDGIGWGRLREADHSLAIVGTDRLARDTFLLTQPLFVDLLALALRWWGLLPLHSCAVDWQGKAIVFPAISGSGKSTLALALLRAGFKLLSDDMPVLQRCEDGTLRLLPFPGRLRVLPPSLDFFPELAARRDQGEPSGPKVLFDTASIYPGSVAAESRPALIVLPQVAHTPTSRIEPCPATEVLTALIGGMAFGSTGASLARALPTLVDLVQQCRTYRLATGTDFDHLPPMLRDLLDQTDGGCSSSPAMRLPAGT